MKCIRYYDTDKIRRVSDDLAKKLVRNGEAKYAPKSEWKEQRNADK